MKLGFVSDSLGGMSFDTLLDNAARMGVSGVEVNTGGWSTAPHFDLQKMKTSADARRTFVKAFQARGLEIIALNANGNPLHPTQPGQAECLKDTIRLAGEMGIPRRQSSHAPELPIGVGQQVIANGGGLMIFKSLPAHGVRQRSRRRAARSCSGSSPGRHCHGCLGASLFFAARGGMIRPSLVCSSARRLPVSGDGGSCPSTWCN